MSESASSFKEIPFKQLVKTFIAKTLIFKGIAIIGTHLANSFYQRTQPQFRIYTWNYALNPFLSYLHPKQVLLEVADLGWKFVTFYLCRSLPSGNMPSLGHLMVLNDSCFQVLLPLKLRWLVTYCVMTNEELSEGMFGMTEQDGLSVVTVYFLRWLGTGMLTAAESKLSDRTPRTWKWIVFSQVWTQCSLAITFLITNKIFYKLPVSTRNTIPKFLATTVGLITLPFWGTMFVNLILNNTLLHPVFCKLNNYSPPTYDDLEVGKHSKYHDISLLSIHEITLLQGYILQYADTPDVFDHSQRIFLLTHLQRITEYMRGLKTSAFPRAPSKFPIAAVPLSPLGPAVLDTPDHSQCAHCNCKLTQEDGGAQLTLCRHLICNGCWVAQRSGKHKDFCGHCFASTESIPGDEMQRLSNAVIQEKWPKLIRGQKMLISEELAYGNWIEAAYVAHKKKVMHRLMYHFIKPEASYQPANTYPNMVLYMFFSLLDFYPVIENNGLPVQVL